MRLTMFALVDDGGQLWGTRGSSARQMWVQIIFYVRINLKLKLRRHEDLKQSNHLQLKSLKIKTLQMSSTFQSIPGFS